jgi:multiple sugar transport system ATP-binding protein
MNFINVQVKDINGKIVISTREFTLHPNEKQQEKLKQYVNKEIVFGVRPEDIYLKAEMPDSKNMIKAFVEVLEPLGAETLVYFKTKQLDEIDIAGEKIIAKVSPNYKVEPGEIIEFAIDMEKTHFFNTEETTRDDGNKEDECIV